MASVVYIKYKEFYDFDLKLTIQLKSPGAFGILFRVTD